MARNTPKPGAGDTGPREGCIADGGYDSPTTPTESPAQSSFNALGKIEPIGESVPAKLQIFEDARRDIADAKTVEQVNRIVALATGLAAAARKATDREMEAEAEVLKLEAERRLGQLIQAQRETVGLNKGGGDQRSDHRVSRKPGGPPTLAEAGIDKNTAHRARQAADMSEADFKEAAEAKRKTVRSKQRKVTESAPKKKGSVAPKDTALIGFDAHVLDLVRRIAKHHAARFKGTAVKADDLAKLGKFFADLAALKTVVAS
jgi:hypothetical protein